jgi:hypothetical protein
MPAIESMQGVMEPMQAAKADWDLIQSLYVSGIKPKEIEARTGVKADTVSARASRKKWVALTARVKETLQVRENGQGEAVIATSNHRSERARNSLAAILERAIDRIEQMPVQSGKAALKLASELEPVVRSCKVIHGWSDSAQSPLVRISVMAGSSVVSIQSDPNKHPFSQSPPSQDQVAEPLSGEASVSHTPPHNFPTLDISTTTTVENSTEQGEQP